MRRVHFLLGADIKTVVVEQVHLAGLLAVDDRVGVIATKPDEQRNRARLHHVKAEEFLIKLAREGEVAAFECAVRQELELESRGRLIGFSRRGRVFGHCHERLHSV